MPNPPFRLPIGVLTALGVVALGLFMRRAGGAVVGDLPIGETAVFAALLTFAAAAALRALRSVATPIISAATFLTGLTFVAGATAEPLSFLAGLAVVVTATAIGSQRSPTERSEPRIESPAQPSAAVEPPPLPVEDAREPVENSAAIFRRSRRGDAVGLEGTLAVTVPAGEQVHAVHVPLWPPLPSDPVVQCELTDLEGRVRVTLAKSYGLRLEIRLSEAIDEPLDGELRFIARARLDETGDHVAA